MQLHIEHSSVSSGRYRPAIGALVSNLQSENQDFEFYPTTDEIIHALVKDINTQESESYKHYSSVLDIGAGHGKVLLALRAGTQLKELHAIEKSSILCQQLDPDILIVGTEFAEQSLLSKHVDVVFCNPPYSVFQHWAERIIRQAASSVVYLVLPIRWESSVPIADALKFRDATCDIIGQFDFQDAEDRTARARVHLLRVSLLTGRNRDDAFERFFKEQFADLIGKFDDTSATTATAKTTKGFSQLVVGPDYPGALVSLYDAEIANVQNNFDLVSRLDPDLLREFNISPDTIMACLKARLGDLRSAYWHELFSHLDTVTDRLTSGSRQRLLDVLHKHVHVDFTLSNIYAVIIWVIKNANMYIDSQLISTYELMVAKCNVNLYKSNQRTWQEEGWRYNRASSTNSHYALEYRIVTHRIGGISNSPYSFESGLDERAACFLGDLLTLARNLGFHCNTSVPDRRRWCSGALHEFYCTDRSGNLVLLYDVRAFKNGNLHLRLNKKFILALNVEHGRLKGWLNSRAEAAEELSDPTASEYFNANLLLPSNPALLLAGY